MKTSFPHIVDKDKQHAKHRQSISREDLAFYSPFIEIVARPPHPLPRVTAYLVLLFIGITIAWCFVGTVDVNAVATGRIVVMNGNINIQPFGPGVIKRVLVKNGDFVQRGAPLVLLDDTEAKLEYASLKNNLSNQIIEGEKSRALLMRMGHMHVAGCTSSPLGTDELDRCNAGLHAEWSEMSAKSLALMAQIAQRESELKTIDEQIAKYQEILPIVAKRHQDFEGMKIQGFVSKYSVQDRLKDRVEIEREIKTLDARRAEATAAITSAKATLESWSSEIKRNLTERISNAGVEATALKLKLEAARFSLSQKVLRAPVPGRVQEISLKNEGEVATAAQNLMVLVPETRSLNIAASLSSADIGFVKIGQPVVIKLDTFSYTKYGYLRGRVTSISSDLISDAKKGDHFTVQIHPDHDYIVIDEKKVPLSPGMTLSAEIATDRRRVIDYAFDPIVRRVTASLHER